MPVSAVMDSKLEAKIKPVPNKKGEKKKPKATKAKHGGLDAKELELAGEKKKAKSPTVKIGGLEAKELELGGEKESKATKAKNEGLRAKELEVGGEKKLKAAKIGGLEAKEEEFAEQKVGDVVVFKIKKRKRSHSIKTDKKNPKGKRRKIKGLYTHADFRKRLAEALVKYEATAVTPYERQSKQMLIRTKEGVEKWMWPGVLVHRKSDTLTIKATVEEVAERTKKRIEDQGGYMIDPYEAGDVPMRYICRRGHFCCMKPMRFNNQKEICGKCYQIDRTQTAADEFKERVEAHGATVIGKFEHCQKGVPCICAEGHACTPCLQSLRHREDGGICKACVGKDYEFAKQQFLQVLKEMGATLLSPYGKSSTEKVLIRCRDGHEVWVSPSNFKKYKSCPECTQSAGEIILGKLLEELKVEVKSQYRIDDSLKRYDFGNSQIVFEYDGGQHFKEVPLFCNNLTFAEHRAVDYQKTKMALETGHRVIRIHYFWLQFKQETKLAFLKAAIASNEPFVVSKLDAYDWLEYLGPTDVEFK